MSITKLVLKFRQVTVSSSSMIGQIKYLPHFIVYDVSLKYYYRKYLNGYELSTFLNIDMFSCECNFKMEN